MSGSRLPQNVDDFDAKVVDVTPALAKEWLARNGRNRGINYRYIETFSRTMAAGEWMLTGEAIKFSVTGDLLDGQHRLMSVLDSGVTVKFLVVYGLPLSAQDTLDQGQKRSAAQQATLHGYRNTSATTSAARLAILYAQGRLEARIPLSNPEVMGYLREHNFELEEAARVASRAADTGLPKSVGTFTYFTLAKISKLDADRFFEAFITGINLEPGSPILALRKRLAHKTGGRTGKELLTQVALIGLVFRAWNAYRTGRTMSTIPLQPRGEPLSVPTPV